MNIKKFVPKKIKKIRAKIKKRIKENKKQLTLKKICNIIGVEIPSDMKKLTNKKASIITRSRLKIEPNFVLFCKTLNGFPMMLFQGAAAFKLWTNQNMPIEHVKEVMGIQY